MGKIKILSTDDIKKLISLPLAIQAVERAYLQKADGAGQVWPMVFHEFDPGHADLDIKSGSLDKDGVFGLKLVSWFGANPDKGLPALFGTSLVFDIATGAPRALLNAGPITAYRTGAAAAIGAKYLSRPDSRTLVMAGCGVMAPYLTAATLLTMPKLESVLLCNPIDPARAAERLPKFTETVAELLKESGCRLSARIEAAEIEPAVRCADVVLTATPAYEPMIRRSWVKSGTHFSCIGADMTGKEELDPEILAAASVFGDDEKQCLSVGECEKPYKQGKISGLDAEIGAVISGSAPGRQSAGELTVFDSTGIALQDIACAAALLELADKAGLGLNAEL